MNSARSKLILALALACLFGQRAFAQDAGDLEKRASGFVNLLVKQDFQKATQDFDATMKQVMPPDKLQETWGQIVESVGAFRKAGGTRREKSGDYDIVFVTCEFQNAVFDAKVVFDRQGRIAGLFFVPTRQEASYRPPPYADPQRFRETEVTFGAEPWQLPGTLTLPAVSGTFPAVILVHGSGPNDRDESVAANKPFKDLAWGLATRGIAVLRYDKRTYAHQQKMAQLQQLTVKEEVLDDVFAAIEFLQEQPRVDRRRIFVAGHSMGGYVAPKLAARDTNGAIAGFVFLAANTRPIEDLLWDQTNYFAALDGSVSEQEKQQLAQLEQLIKQVKDPQVLRAASQPLLGAPPSYWLDLEGYDPPGLAAGQKHPLLILHGARDYQVTMKDYDAWKASLAGRENVQFKLYPDLNHLMIAGPGKSTPAEYQTAGNVDKQVVDDIVAWIKGQKN